MSDSPELLCSGKIDYYTTGNLRMYIRKKGQRFYLLHSYRDGSGRVYQRRLGHFSDENGLRRQLDEIAHRCPELSGSIPDLRLRALEELRKIQPFPSRTIEQVSDKICRAARLLLRLLAEEAEPENLRLVNCELGMLKARLAELVPGSDPRHPEPGHPEAGHPGPGHLEAVHPEPGHPESGHPEPGQAGYSELGHAAPESRPPKSGPPKSGQFEAELMLYHSRLSPRRRRFDPSDPIVRPYCETLDRVLEDLKWKGQIEACCELLKRRIECCPEPESWLEYGAILQRMGRYDEASAAYERLPNRDFRKHYNLASVSFAQGQPEEAFTRILRGLTRDPEAWTRRKDWKESKYWRRFGDLWSQEGLRFLQSISGQTLVRFRLRTSRERGVVLRNLVPSIARKRLLDEAIGEAYALLPASATG